MPGTKPGIVIGMGLATMLLLAATAPAQSMHLPSFSATVVSRNGGHTMRSKFYQRGLKQRTDPQMKGRAAGSYSLMFLDTHKSYTVMPAAHMCLEMQLPQTTAAQIATMAAQAKKDTQVTDLGPATITVAGKSYATEHKKIIYKQANGQHFTIEEWALRHPANIPVKLVTHMPGGQTSTTTYENINTSAPSASLFQAPAHCRKMPGMGGMARPRP